jgi:hypothetical protein
VKQYQITESVDLLNKKGTLKQAGWAKDLLLRYMTASIITKRLTACRLTNQHQLFGYFSGKAILDNGQEVKEQNLLGFAEKVCNRW